jgi:acetyl-CoA/propionyl-CoA carboxylase biotin carboxyl carrier protein
MTFLDGSSAVPAGDQTVDFTTVLVANRGEIAVRIIRTLRRMGIRSVAVYSDADITSPHVRAADAAVRIGPAPARESYLSTEKIIQAAVDSGARAVHPGYGFLSENAEFANACAAAGLTFIGPGARVIELMGDKITAKETVVSAGVRVVPGKSDRDIPEDAWIPSVEEIGYPVLIKPAWGGGGKGMRVVQTADELLESVASARREAASSFGDETLLVERFLTNPRHIEIQILADAHGNVIHLGERECSLQRRHQKIIEEAPSSLLDSDTRARMGAAAVEIARSVGYIGVGTVEFIMSATRPDEFFFMEMNTRLQVEHPVTEMVTGLDLVEWQLRVAAGESLTLLQADIHFDGHAVESRVYAEDPAREFLPTGGKVAVLSEPAGPGIRVDSWLAENTVVGLDYDPMLAKVIAWGSDRASALRRLDHALSETVIMGFTTNIPFLRALLSDPDVQSGSLDTGLVGRQLSTLVSQRSLKDYFIAGSLDRVLSSLPLSPSSVDPWELPYGWRLGADSAVVVKLRAGDERATVKVNGLPGQTVIKVDGEDDPKVIKNTRLSERTLEFECDGQFQRYHRFRDADGALWLGRDGLGVRLIEYGDEHASTTQANAVGPVTSPMPGTVLMLKAMPGDQVHEGDPLLVVEAMKMEHVVKSPADGVLDELRAKPGDRVALDQVLAVVSPFPAKKAAEFVASDSSANGVAAPSKSFGEEEK